MEQLCFPTSSAGGHRAVRDLVDKITWMRRYRGQHVYPVITLSDTFMPTRYGGRQRPHFLIKRWICLDGGQVLPAPEPTARLEDLSATPEMEKKLATNKRGMTHLETSTVKSVTLQEELNDEIPI
jgi:hypothetical protein